MSGRVHRRGRVFRNKSATRNRIRGRTKARKDGDICTTQDMRKSRGGERKGKRWENSTKNKGTRGNKKNNSDIKGGNARNEKF